MLLFLFNFNIDSAHSQISPGTGDFPPDHCYYLHTQCQTSWVNTFSPEPITFTYAVTARFNDGYFHIYNFTATATPIEYGPMMVCFPVNIPIMYITSVRVCTDRTTTDYVVDHTEGNRIYLDMIVPEEATIGGVFYEADLMSLGPIGCQDLWKTQYNDVQWDSIPKWINCQNDINIVFQDGFNLNGGDQSGIILQVAVHEYPIVYTDDPIIHYSVDSYLNGNSINISWMLQYLQPGKRYVLSMATVCDDGRLNLSPTKVSSVIAKANKVRTLIFDYEAEKTWTGQLVLGGPSEYWDNEFPGKKAKYNHLILTTINGQQTNPNADYKYEVIRLNNDGTYDSTLYNSGFIPGEDFFSGNGDLLDHTGIYLDLITSNYFTHSANEYFTVRVTTNDVCDYTVRNVYFRTGGGNNLPPYHGDLENAATSRSIKGDSHFWLYGNPGRILNFDFQSNSSNTAQLFIFNSTGRQILRRKIEEGNIQIHDSSRWATGLYYIVIKSDEEIRTEKWIKQ